MRKRIAILGIDLQNDFTLPTGALSVKGANEDIRKITNFILSHQDSIDYIVLTLDSHQPIHIAHQCYWKDTKGDSPNLYSTINLEDVKNGKWIPQYNKELAIPYLEELASKGEVCTIWPMHCILGSNGWAINEALVNCLSDWTINNNKSYELFYKGYAQSTEHYSIFRAAVEWESQPETQLNTRLLSILNNFDEVLLIGEAADYCVVNSLNDIMKECDELTKKIVILTDCMSWIDPNNIRAKRIYEKAEKRGVRFDKSTIYSFTS